VETLLLEDPGNASTELSDENTVSIGGRPYWTIIKENTALQQVGNAPINPINETTVGR
jgi:hypothetical protein